jgi:hypothetical protein
VGACRRGEVWLLGRAAEDSREALEVAPVRHHGQRALAQGLDEVDVLDAFVTSIASPGPTLAAVPAGRICSSPSSRWKFSFSVWWRWSRGSKDRDVDEVVGTEEGHIGLLLKLLRAASTSSMVTASR